MAGGIVQNHGKRGSELLTVRVVGPVLGRYFGEHHREEGSIASRQPSNVRSPLASTARCRCPALAD